MNSWKTLALGLPLFFALEPGQAMAGQDDCQVHGGGVIDATVFINGVASPEASGNAQFGGSISTTNGCIHVDGTPREVEGPWFIRLADGSRFSVTDPEELTIRIDGILIADIMGYGTYEGQVLFFYLQLEDGGDSSYTDNFIVHGVNPVTGSTVVEAGGYLIRGDLLNVYPGLN